MTTDDVILAGFAAEDQYRGRLKVIGKGFSDELYGIGVQKGDTAMVEKVNAALKQYIEDGSWAKSLDSTVRPSGYSIPDPPHAGHRLTGTDRDRAGAALSCGASGDNSRTGVMVDGRRQPGGGDDADLAALRDILRHAAPFDGLPSSARRKVLQAARIVRFAARAVILDAFTVPSTEVFVVIAGSVDIWNTLQDSDDAADERLGPGGIFGFSAMLIGRSVGPLAVAAEAVTVAADPCVGRRARVCIQHRRPVPRRAGGDRPAAGRRLALQPGRRPDRDRAAGRRHRRPTVRCRATDDRTRPAVRRRPAAGRSLRAADRCACSGSGCSSKAYPPPHRPVTALDDSVPTAVVGDSAAEALISMLDRNADFLLVTDEAGELRGIITPRDFTVSPTTGGVSIHEQVRRASTVAELQERIRRVPSVLDDLLSRQLAPGKVITVYSAIVDTIVRRAITLTFEQHPELSVDAFTWLSLGSNGRREATPSSDIDSAVAFDDAVDVAEIDRYRMVFAAINRLLAGAGLTADGHGATAEQPAFARTNASWRTAAREWLVAPEKDQGAIMTSLLVDGRPIHGDPGLPAVTDVFQEVRRHPGTMRMLMAQSVAQRASYRSIRDIFTRRETFDIKKHALLPIVNHRPLGCIERRVRGAADHGPSQGRRRFRRAAG